MLKREDRLTPKGLCDGRGQVLQLGVLQKPLISLWTERLSTGTPS